MDPVKLRNWALAITATAAVLGPAFLFTKDAVTEVVAQEARKEVQKQMAPVQKSLVDIVEGQRQELDFNKTLACLDRKYRDLSEEDREAACQEESAFRWKHWRWEDCTAEFESPEEKAKMCGPEPVFDSSFE